MIETRDPETVALLVDAFPGSVAAESHGQSVVYVPSDQWLAAATKLKTECGYSMAVDITAVDHLLDEDRWIPEGTIPTRFEIVANFLCMERNRRIRIIAALEGDSPTIASLQALFPGLHNPEREVFDLFGITFEGHPELTRILLPDEWVGAPLRKDAAAARIPVTFTPTGLAHE